MQVKIGDLVKRGSLLFTCKKRAELRFCAPVAGKIAEINLGERRSIQEIVIETDPKNPTVKFAKYTAAAIRDLSRDQILDQLLESGFLSFIRQRPFSKIAESGARPKSIFVNGMNTIPFQIDIEVVLRGKEEAFQAGLNILAHLTDGKVHLALPETATSPALIKAENAEVHTFTGPHPAGNSSVHIAKLDPIRQGDVVWTVDARELILIGELFLSGELPPQQTISFAGPGVKPKMRKHYRIIRGGWLESAFPAGLIDGEKRLLNGDILMGDKILLQSGLRFFGSGITVISEERKREFLGWLKPGLNVFSSSRLFLSRWLRPHAEWDLTTADHGGQRAMFATGVYDRVMPLNIMVDFLIRAVLAHDTEEAVKLGILETEPADFALCSFVCPSRTDVVGIIRQGLKEIEEEGVYE
jgi:Na+-transporting NADH:ubiquinone oxidoreductase subunit A